MKIFGFDIHKAKSTNRKATSAYPSAIITRLNEDFPINIVSADGAARWNLCALRARSQQLEREKGGIGERFLSCVEANIVGPDGIMLQLQIKDASGNFDQAGSQAIEEAWKDFCQMGEFEVTGEHSAQNFDRVSVRSSARDGDLLQLVYRGDAARNGTIQFQLVEGQYLDEEHNVAKWKNGNTIRMGVELDQYKRKVAYWILSKHPGDYGVDGYAVYDRKWRRIPAFGTEKDAPVEAIHVTRTKRPEETRAVPWLTPAMDPITMLAGYEEAELVAARGQASMMVVNERELFAPDGQPIDNVDGSGKPLDEFQPGGVFNNPAGIKSKLLNPTHPTMAFPDFTKDYRRKIAAALNCSYNTLFTDLEGVNYSSIRAGLLDERVHWMMDQNWYIAASKQRQFEAWLRMMLMLGEFTGFGITDLNRIKRATVWKPKRWEWVDPLKDIEASGKAIEYKLSSHTRELAGYSNADFDDIAEEIARERDKCESLGLDPFLNEPKRTSQLIDSADVANVTDGGSPAMNPEVASVSEVPEAPTHHSARQPRAPGGQFNGPPMPKSDAPAKDMDENIKALIEALAVKQQPGVTVNIPPIEIPTPNINIENLNVPERPADVINFNPTVNVPEIQVPAAPDVTVNVETPVVNVTNKIQPPQAQRINIQRDGDGKISEIEVEKS